MEDELRGILQQIAHVKETAQGCATALACANAAAALARGRTAAQILRGLTSGDLVGVLDGLPENHHFLAEQALDTLHGAVRDALLGGRDGWKKLYRT